MYMTRSRVPMSPINSVSPRINGCEFVIPVSVRHNVATAVRPMISPVHIGLPDFYFGIGDARAAVVRVHVTVDSEGVVVVAVLVPRTVLGQSLGPRLIVRPVDIWGCGSTTPRVVPSYKHLC